MINRLVARSEEETYEFGRDFAKTLKNGDVVALDGELGAGKTVFTRGVAAGLNIFERVLSPTFTVMNRYEGRLPLNHFDAYRLKSEDELYDAGYGDCVGDGVTVVEWAGLVCGAIPKNAVRVRIDYASSPIELDEDEQPDRIITITRP